MALIPVTLSVGFISQHAGNHRVCYRLGSSGPYDCSTIVTCTGGGAACSVDIGLTIDNETCDSYQYEGYVQATCEEIGSLIGRIPFTASITPVAPCEAKTLTCTGGIQTIELNNGGSFYVAPPTITVVGGGGSGAILTAVLTGDIVTSIIITDPGSGYTSLPTLVISAPPAGVTAIATVTALTDCGLITFTDCDGNVNNINPGYPGVTTNNSPAVPKVICIEQGSVFTPASEYVVTDSGCCYNCVTTQITAGEEGGSVNYQLCTGEFVVGAPMLEGETIIVCIIDGSLTFIDGSELEVDYGFTVVNLGSCTP